MGCNGHRVILVVPGFCRAEMFASTRAMLEGKWTPGLVDEKWLLLNKYPLPSVEENERDLIAAGERYGYSIFDSGADLGLAGSLNNFFAAHPQPPGTLLMSVDGDSVAADAGFDLALCTVVTTDPNLPVCALGLGHTTKDDEWATDVAGYRVFVHPSTDMTNIGVQDLDWRGPMEAGAKYWGGNEMPMLDRLRATGKHIGYLMDYREAVPDLDSFEDAEYRAYKDAHFEGRFSGSFADYLGATA